MITRVYSFAVNDNTHSERDLDEAINRWIKDHHIHVKDIKYYVAPGWKEGHDYNVIHATVIYEDNEEIK